MRVRTNVLTEVGQSMALKPGMMKALVFHRDQKIRLKDRSVPKQVR